MIRLPLVLLFAALLFSAGVYGVLARRNAVMVLMAIELMLNAVNLNLVAFSASLKDVTGQIFAVRANEIFLMGQSRPLRSVHRAEGWTPETIGAHAIPALRAHFYPLERSQDVFSWDPL